MNKITARVGNYLLVCLVAAFLAVAGCSMTARNSSNSPSDDGGSFKMSVVWPENVGDNEELSQRTIPEDSKTITVSIEGDGIGANPITAGITRPNSVLLVENLPGGPKIATVRAMDESGNVILAQRKESFIIEAAKTATSEKIPLGIAITGSATNPIFEPSHIDYTYGSDLYFQNWLEEDYTCRINICGTNYDYNMTGAHQESGNWVFSEASPSRSFEACSFSIVDKSAHGEAHAPILNYSYVTKRTGFYSPQRIASGSGYIYVSDYNSATVDSSRIYKYTTDNVASGNWISKYACGLDVGPDGYIYVASLNSDSILRYTTSGSLNAEVYMIWKAWPNGIAVSNDGFVYVACTNPPGDTGWRGIRKYNTTSWANVVNWGDNVYYDVAVDSQNNVYYIGSGYLKKRNSSGTEILSLSMSGDGIEIDNYDNIWVVKRSSHCLEKYDSNGNFIMQWGEYGTEDGKLNKPINVCFDESNDNMYVLQNVSTGSGSNMWQQFRPAPPVP